jgi:hypothetical protein
MERSAFVTFAQRVIHTFSQRLIYLCDLHLCKFMNPFLFRYFDESRANEVEGGGASPVGSYSIALVHLSNFHRSLGHGDEALFALVEAIHLAEQYRDPQLLAQCLASLQHWSWFILKRGGKGNMPQDLRRRSVIRVNIPREGFPELCFAEQSRFPEFKPPSLTTFSKLNIALASITDAKMPSFRSKVC